MRRNEATRPKVKCLHCDGTGMVMLSRELWETLYAVSLCKETHAEELAGKLAYEGNVTAINNRLVALMQFGFVKRRKHGKRWMYKAI